MLSLGELQAVLGTIKCTHKPVKLFIVHALFALIDNSGQQILFSKQSMIENQELFSQWVVCYILVCYDSIVKDTKMKERLPIGNV